jgi:hypothetical protein
MPCECSKERTVVRVRGNLVGKPFWIGQRYEMRYRFSTPMLRSASPLGGVVAVTDGRLQLRNITVLFNQTGAFHVEFTPKFSDTYVSTFSGRQIGTGMNHIGQVPLADGTFRVSTPSKASNATIELVNNSHLPSWFTAAEWEGVYETQARRV